MAFFGYNDTGVNDNGKKGAISAVKAALELRDFFMKRSQIGLIFGFQRLDSKKYLLI